MSDFKVQRYDDFKITPGTAGSAQTMTEHVDCVIVGAGVVGLAIGRALARTGREVLVLEAAAAIGTGISSRSSEVVHAGIYNPTDYLKTKLCVAGRPLLYEYCERHHVDISRVGKLIVATSPAEIAKLRGYEAQARRNGVNDLRWLDAGEAKELEPEVKCVAALLSPSTGIVDSHGLMLSLQAEIEAAGGTVVLNCFVLDGALTSEAVELRIAGSPAETLRARTVVNAAGLGAQSLSRALTGLEPESVPPLFLAKGQYFALSGRSPFSHLIYPIPVAGGLGIHATLDIAGKTRFGPDVQWVSGIDYTVDRTHRARFAEAVSRYYPNIDEARLLPDYSGVRPKLSAPGQPAADFCVRHRRCNSGIDYIALYGIESPGLTASLALAHEVVRMLGNVAVPC